MPHPTLSAILCQLKAQAVVDRLLLTGSNPNSTLVIMTASFAATLSTHNITAVANATAAAPSIVAITAASATIANSGTAAAFRILDRNGNILISATGGAGTTEDPFAVGSTGTESLIELARANTVLTQGDTLNISSFVYRELAQAV